jgi:tRNA pseudouridine(38-40) synthase
MAEPSKPRTKLKVIVEYDGKDYSGWAKSPSNPKPSIQEKVEAAWLRLFPQTTFLGVKTASRTDSGVSALGQVITIESDIIFGETEALTSTDRGTPSDRRKAKKLARHHGTLGYRNDINSSPGTAEELYKRINSFLPDDIVFKSSKLVPLSFSAKDHSKRRMYRYEILSDSIRPAIGRHHVWWIKHPLNVEEMVKTAKMYEGTHDMACFCPKSYQPEDASETMKTIEMVRF